MTTTPQQIDALFAVFRVGSDLVKTARRLLIAVDARDLEMATDAMDEMRALVRAHGQARDAMVDARGADEGRS